MADKNAKHARNFTPADARRFYDRFGARQDLQFYENPALERLVALAELERASVVFELGCGTGRLADQLLRDCLPQGARYVGVDVSQTMVRLTAERLGRWRERAVVRLADGTQRWPDADGACDRFVAAYVLDLLDESLIAAVIDEAHRLLAPGGLLCIVALTEGQGSVSRALCAAWRTVHAWRPQLVGGCRPVRVDSVLDRAAWHVEHLEIISTWGVCSEVLIARRR